MPKDSAIKSILIIGSGPIVIGQACEFDYSGSQASRSLREEGIEVTLINSNPATIMTDKVIADNIYLLPLEVDSIEEILQKHNIDAVLPTMGGQTALNLCIKCNEIGVWEDNNVDIIGVDIDAIEITENRQAFRKLMDKIDIPMAPQSIAKSFLQGKEIAQDYGFPLCIRPSYTLGGSGASFVRNEKDFETLLNRGLHASPIHEVMIDKAVVGWKEFELELLRDKNDNVTIICSIENMDPMGIHTGDSITVAPAMTLSDKTYQKMRDMAIKMMRAIGDFAGGCNVQFAVSDDEKEDIIAIEINPRVSRSSALASKATGYPIAKIAAKLAIGYTLDELDNQITKSTSAFFEPTLDYVIVKIPRWNFNKFKGSDRKLGLQMKSVGEVMGIGRSFQEALQKACQSLEISRNGLGADGKELINQDEILKSLEFPSWNRLFHIYDAIKLGIPFKKIQQKTRIDDWFLRQIKDLLDLENKLENFTIENISYELFFEAKQKGYADRQLGHLFGCLESEVFKKRQELGIKRVYKLVDTCAAEFRAETPYFYSTFEQENESIVSNKPKIVVLGSGPNRIGQGIEFDYCCVHGVLAAKECGYETIMINCNPETVSTDFDTADKLYFEPVFWEHIYDIILHEKPEGVIVQLGGQTALKLAEKLDRYGIKVIGTSFKALDLAEDRGSFSNLLKDNNIPYPRFGVVESAEQALEISKDLGFPLLVRPSYVLGGMKMKIVINEEDLEHHVVDILKDMPDNQILLDHFLDGAIEAEADAICDGKDVKIIGIMQHIEPAGIHSGDSYAVLPPYNLGDFIIQQIEEYTHTIAKALKTVGLINIQFAIKDDVVYIIEANPRASRTVPFISKAYNEPYVNYAAKVMMGKKKVKDFDFKPEKNGYAIKIPVFSFEKFPNVNKELGPEMKSTGEAIKFIKDLKDPFFRKIYSERNLYLSK
jgi:carbamoyl-phosphate synthase large subunit